MNHPALFYEFRKNFKASTDTTKGIGIEAELPIVTFQGEVPEFAVIQGLFTYLEAKGFRVKRDHFSGFMVEASQINVQSSKHFTYCVDTITTEAGYGVLEVVLAPQQNIHDLQYYFMEIIQLLYGYLSQHHCLILGFGIQPVTPPSAKLLMPKERYLFFSNFSQNNVISKANGNDAHLLTITASNQCHIDIAYDQAIPAVNVLNALSGLQILLHANSSIWQGAVDTHCKANREFFWEQCYPARTNQMGIPPQFATIEAYFQYLLEFKPMLVKREQQLLQVLGKATFSDFIQDKTPGTAQTLEGDQVTIQPQLTDIHYLNTFCYFNARLVPQYGTIESRMCCQQPPGETFAPTALTLGILENLGNAQKLMRKLPWETWKAIRVQAGRKTFDTQIHNRSIIPWLQELVNIAAEGLQQRNLGEECFLEPLYQRIAQRKSPADVAVNIFETQGLASFLAHFAFQDPTAHHHQSLAGYEAVNH
ncbi:MAG TPA: hypothetical protein DCS93_13665 [Microscillaceae bacterium]|nr:hypothetical protein [Microscillaceae bacterium]